MNIQEIAEQLEKLEGENGRLEPEAVVEAARDTASPMHAFFDWNDTSAAHQFRLGQARQLIRRIKIEVIVREVPMDVVKYVRDPDNAHYRPISRVRTEEDTARRVLADEMSRVGKAARRARQVAAVLGSQEDVQEIIRLAGLVQRRTDVNDRPAGEA